MNENTYDLLYQQMLGPIDVPGSDLALVPVQRSSRVIVHDKIAARRSGRSRWPTVTATRH
jgi:hypothetical protein